MPTSNATIAVNKMELTPMRVSLAGSDLGGTLGNVAVKFKRDKAEIKADQLGTTVLDRRISGMMTTVEFELAEVQNFDKWKAVFPSLNLVTSGPNKLLQFANKMGVSDYDQAVDLVLHPLNRADADKSQDYKFYKVMATEESEVVYGPSEQVKLKLVFNVYPDLGTTGYPMWIKGDPTVGLVAASAGSAVAGSNTGNGTVGSIVAYSGFTLTETITLLAVGAASNAGAFSVTGSVSGALGVAVVGTPFTSSKISFTISDGSTDFVVGDSFTIATVAANYV